MTHAHVLILLFIIVVCLQGQGDALQGRAETEHFAVPAGRLQRARAAHFQAGIINIYIIMLLIYIVIFVLVSSY